MEHDHHQSAKQLIIEASRRSGLLQETAELLWFAAEHVPSACCSDGECPACELLDRLSEELGNLVLEPALTATDLFGEGLNDISPPPDRAHEVAPFVGEPIPNT